MATEKHTPMRTCIATGVKKPKSELIRLVRLDADAGEGFQVKVDPKGKERGRGASLDSNIEAFDLAIKKGAIERALKIERKLSAAEAKSLRADFEKVLEEREFRRGNKPVIIKVSKEEFDAKLGGQA